jgi:hypothetical protein
MIYSEATLQLQPIWFTGRQWADGTAMRYFKQEYREAILRQKQQDIMKRQEYFRLFPEREHQKENRL